MLKNGFIKSMLYSKKKRTINNQELFLDVPGPAKPFWKWGGQCLVSKEVSPWLGPMEQKILRKFDPSDWLKHTLNQVYALK